MCKGPEVSGMLATGKGGQCSEWVVVCKVRSRHERQWSDHADLQAWGRSLRFIRSAIEAMERSFLEAVMWRMDCR